MTFRFDHWELEDIRCKNGRRKRVRYNDTCDVILIPSKEEYIECGIYLWYNSKDYSMAKCEASKEIRYLLERAPNLSLSSALRILYQPGSSMDKYWPYLNHINTVSARFL
jgi:hypothetical protein